MGKLDISTIEGYASMTPEQKVAALEALDIPDPDYSGYVKKTTFDQTASELAAWKKKYNDTLSADEQAKIARETELADLRSKVESLTKEKTLGEHKSSLIAQGYSEALANEAAKALMDGDSQKFFACQKAFLEEHDKKTKQDILKGTPRPGNSDGDPTMTLEKLQKMSPSDRYNWSLKNPEKYNELYGGTD